MGDVGLIPQDQESKDSLQGADLDPRAIICNCFDGGGAETLADAFLGLSDIVAVHLLTQR